MPASGRHRVLELLPWCLMCGGATTVLLAWAAALWSRTNPGTDRQFLHVAANPGGPGTHDWTWNVRSGPGVRWLWVDLGDFRVSPPEAPRSIPIWASTPDPQAAPRREFLAAGWPFVCMCAQRDESSARMTRTMTWDWAWTLQPAIGNDPFSVRLLPLKPAPWGAALDTGFWAVLWAPLIARVRTWIGRRREDRGHCPACRYDLRGLHSERCPECGAALTRPVPAC